MPNRRPRRPKSRLPSRHWCEPPPPSVLSAFAAARAALAAAKAARIVSRYLAPALFVAPRKGGRVKWWIAIVDTSTGAFRRVPMATARRAAAADLVPFPSVRWLPRGRRAA